MKHAKLTNIPMAPFKQYRFPLRNGNHFELLVDGDVFFTQMLEAIGQAQHYILLEQYLVKSGRLTSRFIQQLSQAVKRGVSVYFMLDDYGASDLQRDDRQRLKEAGIHSCFFNPVRFKRFFHSLFRNHRKSLLIDGQVAFVGGAGLADEFSTEITGAQAWHDVMLEMHGSVVQDWQQLFIQTWQRHSTQAIKLAERAMPSSQTNTNNQTGRLLTASPLQRQEINRALIKHLRRAQTRVWISSPYFVASRKLRRILRQTAWRGVDVRLLLPGPFSDHPWISHATRRHYMRMLKSHVRIFEYQPRFIHAKIELCDDWVSIGSSNLDRWNQHWNLDANQAVYDAHFARDVTDLFNRNFDSSEEIILNKWQQRPCLTRLREGLSGQIVAWLERLSRRHR